MNITQAQKAQVLKLLHEFKDNAIVIEEKCDKLARNMEQESNEIREHMQEIMRMQNQVKELSLRISGQLKPAPWNKDK
jgi:GTP-binding protein EngB required for normal cell division